MMSPPGLKELISKVNSHGNLYHYIQINSNIMSNFTKIQQIIEYIPLMKELEEIFP